VTDNQFFVLVNMGMAGALDSDAKYISITLAVIYCILWIREGQKELNKDSAVQGLDQ